MSTQKNDFFKSQPWVPDLLEIIITIETIKTIEIFIQKMSNNILQEEKKKKS